MRVILLDKIAKLGTLGDLVNVKPGFGRNYLIPKGKAVFASESNIKSFEARRAELEKKMQDDLAQAQAVAEKLQALTIEIPAKALDEFKLYGSIGNREVLNAVNQAAGIKLHKKEVILPNGAIRTLGEHEVRFQLHADVAVALMIKVVAEKE